MIYGAHAIVFSRAPGEARALLEKILDSNKVDAGGGWLIFALPPAEIAVHPTDEAPRTDLYLMCQDIEKTVDELREKGVTFSRAIKEVSWGRVTAIALPGGGELGLYQPRHQTALARPPAAAKGGAKARPKARTKAGAKAGAKAMAASKGRTRSGPSRTGSPRRR
jgi:hypothetical protein